MGNSIIFDYLISIEWVRFFVLEGLMILYQYENPVFLRKIGNGLEKAFFSEKLLRCAFRDFIKRESVNWDESMAETLQIKRNSHGKPFFYLEEIQTPCSISFSISHSESYWGCLMGNEPVGFDLEFMKNKRNYKQIARRFFSKEEYQLVEEKGMELFFDIWVRKEAYVKLTGNGLAEGLNTFSVVQEAEFLEWISRDQHDKKTNQPIYISGLALNNQLKAAYCNMSGNQICQLIHLDL